MPAIKLYCYVDETGQDTRGELFLVTVLIKEIKDLVPLENKLEEIEDKTGKKKSKWKKTNKKIKLGFLEALVRIKALKGAVFYSVYLGSKEYPTLTALTIAKAVLSKGEKNYTTNIIIDGLNKKERQVVRGELSKLKIKCRKIRGMRDEQNIFLRLADAMAGFLRDCREKEPYTKKFAKEFLTKAIVKEV